MLSTQNLTSLLDDTMKKEHKIKKNNEQRGALRIEIREMDEHSTARGQLYYLLTLKIITCLARAETWTFGCRRPPPAL